jgi:hypothetical protein
MKAIIKIRILEIYINKQVLKSYAMDKNIMKQFLTHIRTGKPFKTDRKNPCIC